MPPSQLIAFSPITLGEGIKAGTRRVFNAVHTINAASLGQEAYAALPVGVAGTIDRGFAYILANTLDGPSDLTVRRSQSNTPLTLPVHAGYQGPLGPSSATVAFAAADDLTWGLDTRQAATGGVNPILVATRFQPTDPDGTYSWGYTGGSGGGFSTAHTTRYASIGGTVAFQATRAWAQARIPMACVASGMAIELAKNLRTTPIVYRFQINGVDGNQVIVVPAGGTGRFVAAAGLSDTLAPGDLVNYSATTGAGESAFNARWINTRLRSTARQWLYACTNVNALILRADEGPRYVPLAGNLANAHPDEGVTQVPLFAQRVSQIACYVSANNATTTTVVSTRVNGGAGLCAFVIAPKAVGWFDNLVDGDDLVDGSRTNLALIPGGGSGKVIVRAITLLGETVV